MAVADITKEMQKLADDESQVWRLAGECIRQCDMAGGITVQKEGMIRVAQAMLLLLGERTDDVSWRTIGGS